MSRESHAIRRELSGVIVFIAAIWGVFLASWVFPGVDQFGVVPRRMVGLVGIPAMPFLHANLQHILGNTIPLFILLILLAGSRAESWEVVVFVSLLGGLLLWIFGREAVHIGASGLISGLIAFLILSGFLEKRLIPLLIALFVAFFYGGSLILGIIPRFGSQISWDGHLCGALAGAVVAWALAPTARPHARESGAALEQDRVNV
jgi:membrane associated rhomboid family serine protease